MESRKTAPATTSDNMVFELEIQLAKYNLLLMKKCLF